MTNRTLPRHAPNAPGRRAAWPASSLAAATLLLIGVGVASRPADAQQPTADPRWTAVARALGREGETEDGYYRVQFPRRDLTVHIGDHTLAPAFELTSYFAFVPTTAGRVLTMGELVLREDEVNAVMEEARRQGVAIPALHNHLLGESPRLVYAHLMATGDAAAVGQKLRALLARTATPVGPQAEAAKGQKAAWAAANAALGEPEEVEGETAEWEFPRRERITEDGVAVKSSGALETASEVVFQRLPGGRAATTGEIFLAPSEITPVEQTLEAGGIGVTAIHTHMVKETPRLYWLHWYGVGDPAALARTVRAALSHTNSALPGTASKGGA